MSFIEEMSSTYFTWVVVIFAMFVIIILGVILVVQDKTNITVIDFGIFLGPENFLYLPFRDSPYGSAFALGKMIVDDVDVNTKDRNFIEHVIQSTKYRRLDKSGSEILQKDPLDFENNVIIKYLNGGLSPKFLGIAIKIQDILFLKKTNEIDIYTIDIPIVYKDVKSTIEITIDQLIRAR